MDEVSFEGVARYIASGKVHNIITMAGAGISTCIPDYRSPGTGLYDQLKAEYNVTNPQELNSIEFFKNIDTLERVAGLPEDMISYCLVNRCLNALPTVPKRVPLATPRLYINREKGETGSGVGQDRTREKPSQVNDHQGDTRVRGKGFLRHRESVSFISKRQGGREEEFEALKTVYL
nr:hypothetical protein BaRGS_000596 [Batillaria attramentaria]